MVAGLNCQDATVAHTIERLVSVTEGKSTSALAGLLGVSHQAIYNAKSKNKIPNAWFVEVGVATGTSIDWLLTGKGLMRHEKDAKSQLEPKDKPSHSIDSLYSRCEMLEDKLGKEREMNRELVVENRQLWKENGDLREKCARMEERENRYSAQLSRQNGEVG